MKHLKDDFGMTAEQKCVFSDEEVATLVAKARDIDTTPTGR